MDYDIVKEKLLNAFELAKTGDYSLIKKILPCGNGFDDAPYGWIFTVYNDYFTLSGNYHVMNSVGYYVGWVNFTIKFYSTIKNNQLDCRIIIFNYDKEIEDEIYMLDDYIIDTIYYNLEQFIEEE